jgi:hypothetical protein
MIRIEISAAAYAAIAAGRSPDSLMDAQKSPQGSFYLWVEGAPTALALVASVGAGIAGGSRPTAMFGSGRKGLTIPN